MLAYAWRSRLVPIWMGVGIRVERSLIALVLMMLLPMPLMLGSIGRASVAPGSRLTILCQPLLQLLLSSCYRLCKPRLGSFHEGIHVFHL